MAHQDSPELHAPGRRATAMKEADRMRLFFLIDELEAHEHQIRDIAAQIQEMLNPEHEVAQAVRDLLAAFC
jgi:hypothetical protein